MAPVQQRSITGFDTGDGYAGVGTGEGWKTDAGRRASANQRLLRAVMVTEIAGLVLLRVVSRLLYRNQDLRRRAQGAVARWENDIPRRR